MGETDEPDCSDLPDELHDELRDLVSRAPDASAMAALVSTARARPDLAHGIVRCTDRTLTAEHAELSAERDRLRQYAQTMENAGIAPRHRGYWVGLLLGALVFFAVGWTGLDPDQDPRIRVAVLAAALAALLVRGLVTVLKKAYRDAVLTGVHDLYPDVFGSEKKRKQAESDIESLDSRIRTLDRALQDLRGITPGAEGSEGWGN